MSKIVPPLIVQSFSAITEHVTSQTVNNYRSLYYHYIITIIIIYIIIVNQKMDFLTITCSSIGLQ